MSSTRRAIAAVVLLLGLTASAVGCSGSPGSPSSAVLLPARTFHAATDGVAAKLYLPPARSAAAPGRARAILLFGGSEGGMRETDLAVALADRGFVVLELGYFAVSEEPRLPATLANIPIEYFATAVRVLGTRPEVDPGHVTVWGSSRGSEAAALLAGTYPDLIHGAVLSSPSSVANPGYPDTDQPAWTLHGRPVPTLPRGEYPAADPADAPRAFLPVEKITGPIVTICGGRDTTWPACGYSAVIARRAGPARVTALSYPDAGHVPVELGALLTAGHSAADLRGGTPDADIAAEQDALPRIAAVLEAR